MKGCLIACLLGVVLATGCAPEVPFTQAVRQEYKLTVDELESLQFYTSSDIILQRAATDIKEKATTDGTLNVRNRSTVQEVVIPAGTPCVVHKVIDGERMAISFGDGPKSYLVFGATRNRDGFYTLQALEWDRGRGKIVFDDITYRTQPGADQVYLLFKMKGIRAFEREQKVVRGQRL